MAQSQTLDVTFRWPPLPQAPLRETYFFGVWHPKSNVNLSWASPPSSFGVTVRGGPNWVLAGSTIPGDDTSLVHAPDPSKYSLSALAFRGYIVDPPIHSWSESSVLRYWAKPPTTHNGVFAAVLIDQSGDRIRLVSDAFGIAPLYIRRIVGGGVLFSTSPRYLTRLKDHPDSVAQRIFYHRSALCGDVTLTPETRRVGPGQILEFSSNGTKTIQWLDFETLPAGDSELNANAFCRIERAFQKAVDRCLGLMPDGPVKLPLSGGEDSRRILCALKTRGAKLEAITVKVLKDCGDCAKSLDGPIASELAKRFNFPHRVYDYANPEQYQKDFADFRLLFNSEISEHTWMAPMVQGLDTSRCLLFDGLAGDILGNTERYLLKYTHLTEADRLAAIVEDSISELGSKHLASSQWSTLGTARRSLATFLRFLPPNRNCGIIAMILNRCSRGTGLWCNHLLPPGCVPVFPYLDLDYVKTALSFMRSEDSKIQTWQSECLARYYPEYFEIPSTRRIPPHWPRTSKERLEKLASAQLAQLYAECGDVYMMSLFRKTRLSSYAAVMAGRCCTKVARKCQSWIRPLLILESHEANSHRCWCI